MRLVSLLFLTLSYPVLIFGQLDPTPFVGRGPLFPVNHKIPMDNDLTVVKNSTGIPEGEIIEVRGTILNTKGQAVNDAEILIWQTDTKGQYDHPEAARMMGKDKIELDPCFQYWGKTVSDKNGNYFFKTIMPKAYLVGSLQRPAHIHFQVTHPDYKYLSTEVHFPGDQYLENDRITENLDSEDHEQLMARITIPPKGYGPRIIGFNIVLQLRQEEKHK